MKIYYICLALGGLLFFACSDANDPEPVQRIDKISIFDVGNEGNASDISVVFSIRNIARIGQFRILVIPSEISGSFDRKQAFLLTPERYSTVALSNSQEYSVRLSSVLDVEGNPIVANKEYVVKILMVGERFNQLSQLESNWLTLREQGIYNGYYQGVLVHNILAQDVFLQQGQERTLILRGEITESGVTDKYLGSFTTESPGGFGGPIIESGTVIFSLESDSIKEFGASGSLATYVNTYVNCRLIDTGIINGVAKNELQLEILGEGCGRGKFEMQLVRAMPGG